MNTDPITRSIASMGLLNGTIRLVPSSKEKELGRVLFTCAGQYGYIRDSRIEAREGTPVELMTVLEYLAGCRFSDVLMSVASTLGDMSLKGAEAYNAVLETVQAAGMQAMAALEPPGGEWPDAMLAALPYLKERGILKARPYARVFQCMCALYLAAESAGGMTEDGIEEACRADGSLILASEPIADGSVRYTGWSSAAGRAVSFWCVPVDISKPWTVVDGPNGESVDASVRPMRLAAAGISYYDGGQDRSQGWCVVESAMTGRPSVTPFDNAEDALSHLMERFLAANDEAGEDNIVPEASHAEPDGTCAILSVRKNGGVYWRRWDVARLKA